MSVGELIVSIIGDMNGLHKVLSDVQKDVGDVGTRLNAAGAQISSAGSAMTAAITVPIVGAGLAFAGVAKEGMEFEKGMAQVYTLIPDMSKEAFGQMSADTLQFAKDMKVPTEEVLPALYDAIGSGIPQDNVFSFLEVAQKGAVAGATNVGVSVDTLTSLINAYGAENLIAADASDILFAGINVGKMSYEELRQSLSQVIPTAASLQIPLEQVVGALAAMTAQGTPTAQSTTQLSRLFNELAKEGTSAYDTFKEISGKSFPQFIKEGGTVEDALKLMREGFLENSPAAKELEKRMQELADPTSGLALEFESLTGKTFKEFRKEGGDVSEAFKILGINTEEADGRLSDMFGSIEAGNAVLTLTSRDGAILTDVMAEMERSAGQTDAAFAKMSDTTSYSFEVMRADIKNAATELGYNLLPVIQGTIVPLITNTLIPALEIAIKVIGAVAEAFNKLPQPIKLVIITVIAFMAALGPVLVVIGSVVSAIGTLATAFGSGGMLVGALAFAKTAIAGIVTAIGTIGAPLLIAVGAVALFAVAWRNNWFDIQGKFQAAKALIETAMKNFSDILQRLWHGMIMAASSLRTNLSTIWNTIVTVFSTVGNSIISAVQNLYSGLQSWFNSLIAAGQSLLISWRTHWSNFQAATTAAANVVNSILITLNNYVVTQFNRIRDAALGILNNWRVHWANFQNATQSASNMVNSVLNTLYNYVNTTFNLIRTATQNLLASWQSHWSSFQSATNSASSSLGSALSSMYSNVLSRFNSIISAAFDLLIQWRTTWNDIVSAAKNAGSQLVSAISGLPTSIRNLSSAFNNAGKAILDALYDSIVSGFNKTIKKAKDMLAELRSYLPSSPAEQGPFSKLPDWSSAISQPLNKSVSEAASTAKNAGTSIIGSISNGLKSAATSLYNSAKSTYKKLKSLIPSSPAEDGPFSEIPNWDSIFYDPMKESIIKAAELSKPLSQALSSVRSPIDTFSGGFSRVADVTNNSYAGDTITIGPNTLANGLDVRMLIEELNKYTANKRRARGLFT